jgi:Ser/Thr protein kinase RdoA (MazF antagonist)
VAEWVERLSAIGLPEALVHNDLHANNVFPTADGRLRFFDFGDAVLAHPLSALMIPLNVLAHRFEAPPDDARLRRVADAGLEVWSDIAPSPELRAALPAALQLGRLGRVESWLRVCVTLTDEELAEYGDAAPYWLASLQSEPILA